MPEEKMYLEIRMPITGNETLVIGNNGWYYVNRVYPFSRTSSEVARFNVKQVYGTKRAMGDAFVLEETPKTKYGLFIVQKYEYFSGSRRKTIGASFTQKGAHAFAQTEAIKYARKLTKRESLAEVVNRINEDTATLRKVVGKIRRG